MAISTGPCIRATGRVVNQNSCGSGAIVGIQPDGRALILTNAHVAGTQLGRVVTFQVESQNRELIQAKVIIAAYSNSTSSDWSLLETLQPYTKVKPVPLYKGRPTGDGHYTKGFPRCQPHNGTDIVIVEARQYVIFWEPDAIGGQSGSSVWNDKIERAEMLLTWQWNNHGAGQPTSAIYGEMSSFQLRGQPLAPGMIEVVDYDFTGIPDSIREAAGNPIVEEGYHSEAGIRDYPIWWSATEPEDPEEPGPSPELPITEFLIEQYRAQEEFYGRERAKLEKMIANNGTGADPGVLPPPGDFDF